MLERKSSRRSFIASVVATGALVEGSAAAQRAGNIRGFDHVALPMQNTEAMLSFYRGLGLQVSENENIYSVYIGEQMLCLERYAGIPEGDVGSSWREGGRRSRGRQGGRKKAASSVYVRDPDGNLLEFMIYP